jgi:FkbM family methyltransferase
LPQDGIQLLTKGARGVKGCDHHTDHRVVDHPVNDISDSLANPRAHLAPSTALKALAKKALAAVGVEDYFRSARRAIRHTFEPSERKAERRQGYLEDQQLKTLLALLLTARSNCIDVGAHHGAVLDWMHQYAPHGHHVAFEPLPSACELLRAKFPQADIHQIALSDAAGTEDFVMVESLTTRSGFRQVSYPGRQRWRKIQVETAPLDAVLPRGYVPSLVKIDVEGAEMKVFEGAKETLRRHRPVVVFEHQARHAEHYDVAPLDVYRFMVDTVGMRIFDLAGNGPYSAAEFQAVQSAGAPFNFVAHD